MFCCFPGDDSNAQDMAPTQKAKSVNDMLRLTMILQLVLAILKFVCGEITSGLIDLMATMIICCHFYQMHYCNCLMYVIILFLEGFYAMTDIGTFFQHDDQFFPGHDDWQSSLYLIVQCLTLVFCFFAGYWAFQGYKEFKAIYLEMAVNPGAHQRQDNERGSGFGGYQNGYQAPMMYGGDSTGQYPSGSSANASSSNNASSSRGFHAFQGEGRRIGGE
mmetsp:Transcript_2218/g.2302  ORF Transcript_2218/g.2302 Transcript_2218/m.2302 type:complete len:218 (-) Transcript_2218:298-951(-)|eukprot:CAMPEP_0114995980 /NCGR_PEP_ID=MMETSP0216-20121206/14046_1 /TAXON_ID=223996 /ORGANISM="Protocruzia adherens, Strain Boccale" /LENGTH=217 /DNA_ID=CAMNT_0002360113 /DNA_START=56 /DNA_END=709 /DNA_ORIENTATION=+